MAAKVLSLRLDDRMLARLEREVQRVRDAEGEARRSSLVRRLIHEALAAREAKP